MGTNQIVMESEHIVTADCEPADDFPHRLRIPTRPRKTEEEPEQSDFFMSELDRQWSGEVMA